jgi:hypothetical protein
MYDVMLLEVEKQSFFLFLFIALNRYRLLYCRVYAALPERGCRAAPANENFVQYVSSYVLCRTAYFYPIAKTL